MNTAEHAEIRHLMGHGTDLPSREDIEDVLWERWKGDDGCALIASFDAYVDGQIELLIEMLEVEQDEREMWAESQREIAKGTR